MRQVQFDGGIPAAYDAYFRPLLFDPYARWLAKRFTFLNGVRVLELAAGTGALTYELIKAMPEVATLVATDLHEPMLEAARASIPEDPRLRFQVANAQELPFSDASFDVILCQFGWMFFPDKQLAADEALRVLAPKGTLGILVWKPTEMNESALIVKQVIERFLPEGIARFFDVPYGFSDREPLEQILTGAEFSQVHFEDVVLMGSATPGSAARGFCRGTPLSQEIAERLPGRQDEVQDAVANAFAKRYGDGPFETELHALYVEAFA